MRITGVFISDILEHSRLTFNYISTDYFKELAKIKYIAQKEQLSSKLF